MTTVTSLDFAQETVIYLDDEFYTTIGAMKAMGIKQTTLSKEIREGNITPQIHPGGYLFTKDSVAMWLDRRTKRILASRKRTR